MSNFPCMSPVAPHREECGVCYLNKRCKFNQRDQPKPVVVIEDPREIDDRRGGAMNVGDLVVYVGAPLQGLTEGDLGSVKGGEFGGKSFWVSFDAEKPAFHVSVDEIMPYDSESQDKPAFHVSVDEIMPYDSESQDKPDMVNHPPHYKAHPSGVECIDITRHMNFNLGNVVKYLWRADHKSATVEDLEKAAWYLNDEIDRLKNRS